MLSEAEINNLNDEEYADYVGDLSEINQRETRRTGRSQMFETRGSGPVLRPYIQGFSFNYFIKYFYFRPNFGPLAH